MVLLGGRRECRRGGFRAWRPSCGGGRGGRGGGVGVGESFCDFCVARLSRTHGVSHLRRSIHCRTGAQRLRAGLTSAAPMALVDCRTLDSVQKHSYLRLALYLLPGADARLQKLFGQNLNIQNGRREHGCRTNLSSAMDFLPELLELLDVGFCWDVLGRGDERRVHVVNYSMKRLAEVCCGGFVRLECCGW